LTSDFESGAFGRVDEDHPKMADLNGMEVKSGQDYASKKSMMRLGVIQRRTTRKKVVGDAEDGRVSAVYRLLGNARLFELCRRTVALIWRFG